MKEHLLFFKQFIFEPCALGAVAPSSPHLSKEIVRQADVEKAGLVLEFGPGTGVATEEIIRVKRKDADFVAVENNENFADLLCYKFPDVQIVHDDAANIKDILINLDINEKADSIVSGLPWAAFDDNLQNKLMDAVYGILKEGGVFATFAYLSGLILPAGQKFNKKIKKRFSKVNKSKIIWKNLPPAFVYRCIK